MKVQTLPAGITEQPRTYVSNEVAVGALIEKGMEVYVPTAEEIAMFSEMSQQPVIEWIKTQIDPQWVDGFMAEIEKAKAELKAP